MHTPCCTQIIKVGIALHWNKVCGDCFPVADTANHSEYNATYYDVSGAMQAVLNTVMTLF